MSTAIPTVLDALLAVAAVSLPNVQVSDGPPTITGDDYLAVGYTTGDDDAAVTSNRDTADYGQSRDFEVFDVLCEASAFDGDLDARAARLTAFGMLDTYSAAIRADTTLGGTCARARVTTVDLAQAVDNGSIATLQFTVHVEAWRQP